MEQEGKNKWRTEVERGAETSAASKFSKRFEANAFFIELFNLNVFVQTFHCPI